MAISRVFWGLTLCFSVAACGRASPTVAAAPGPEPAGGAKVLASVNGTKLTEYDVAQRSKQSGGHGAPAAPPSTAAVLGTIVREELVKQRALELGLDSDPEYQKKLGEMQAQLAMFQRQKLGELFFKTQLSDKVSVSDDEAREYFEKNGAKVKTEIKIYQILYTRDETSARAALGEIKGGQNFETVAARRFVGLPAGEKKPWDLGYLRWSQMPEQWWGVVFDLKPGEVSDVIRGEDGRFWVLQVVDKRQVADVNFEDVKPRILTVLQRERMEARRAELTQSLYGKAKIEYTPGNEPPQTPN